MKTKHLDIEIERLSLMERTKDLSKYGQDMLNEFRAIKQALTIPVVVGRSEQLLSFKKWERDKCRLPWDAEPKEIVEQYLSQ